MSGSNPHRAPVRSAGASARPKAGSQLFYEEAFEKENAYRRKVGMGPSNECVLLPMGPPAACEHPCIRIWLMLPCCVSQRHRSYHRLQAHKRQGAEAGGPTTAHAAQTRRHTRLYGAAGCPLRAVPFAPAWRESADLRRCGCRLNSASRRTSPATGLGCKGATRTR